MEGAVPLEDNPPGGGRLGFNNTRPTQVAVEVDIDDGATQSTHVPAPPPVVPGHTVLPLPSGTNQAGVTLGPITRVVVTVQAAPPVALDVTLSAATPRASLTGIVLLAPNAGGTAQNCVLVAYEDHGGGSFTYLGHAWGLLP